MYITMTSTKETIGGEQPIFTIKAHVFHIDPKTKRSWVPASTASVNVSFFYDSTRSLYRIISVEGTKPVINSTVTPTMAFTKTSQKFGQWSDLRANTVYGLGFTSESELTKFIEKFDEVKDATRLAAGVTSTTPPTTTVIIGGTATTVGSANASPVTSRAFTDPGLIEPPNMHPMTPSSAPDEGAGDGAKNVHQRSQSFNTSQVESPKHQTVSSTADTKTPPIPPLPAVSVTTPVSVSSTESQLKYENDRLKLALAHSSANAKKWEVELATLKNNNMRLTSALQESTANVDEWKRQLQSYKEDNQRLKNKYIELETSKCGAEGTPELRKELSLLRSKLEALEVELKAKDEDIKRISSTKNPQEERCKMLLQENAELQASINMAQNHLETSLSAQDSQRRILETLNAQLAIRIQELVAIHREITAALQT